MKILLLLELVEVGLELALQFAAGHQVLAISRNIQSFIK
jgi:hypothetical protein